MRGLCILAQKAGQRTRDKGRLCVIASSDLARDKGSPCITLRTLYGTGCSHASVGRECIGAFLLEGFGYMTVSMPQEI